MIPLQNFKRKKNINLILWKQEKENYGASWKHNILIINGTKYNTTDFNVSNKHKKHKM